MPWPVPYQATLIRGVRVGRAAVDADAPGGVRDRAISNLVT